MSYVDGRHDQPEPVIKNMMFYLCLLTVILNRILNQTVLTHWPSKWSREIWDLKKDSFPWLFAKIVKLAVNCVQAFPTLVRLKRSGQRFKRSGVLYRLLLVAKPNLLSLLP